MCVLHLGGLDVEFLCGPRPRLVDQFLRGKLAYAARTDQGAGAAGVVADQPLLRDAFEDAHLFDRDAERFGDHHCEGRLVALTRGVRDGVGRDRPVGGAFDRNLVLGKEPGAGVFDHSGNPDAAELALLFRLRAALREALPVGNLQRFLEDRGHVRILISRAGRCLVRKRLRRDEIAAAQLGRIHLQLEGRLIHQALDDVCDVRPSGAAIGGHGNRVGKYEAEAPIERRNTVDPCQASVRIASMACRAGGREVGAHVGEPVDAQRQEFPVAVERKLAVDRVPATVRVGHEAFRAGRDPLHRLAQFLGREHLHAVLGVSGAALTEASADILRVHDDLFLREIGRKRELLAQHIDALDAGVDVIDVFRGVILHSGGAQLERVRRDPRHFKPRARHVRGAGHCGLDGFFIAAFEIEGEVPGRICMQLRSTLRHRFFHRNHRGQIAVLDLDQFRSVLRGHS